MFQGDISLVKRFGNEKSHLEVAAHKDHEKIKAPQYKRLSKGFMGQTWDGGDVAFQPETWAEVLRVLKPGGHLVAFSGTRTYHRMAVAIEDAGFEVRDMIAWHYGSGFPKSHDISKAIDRIKDWSLVEKLSEEIKRARTEAGLSLKEIGEAAQAATDGQYGAWYHRGGHMFFETGRSLPSRPEWEQLRKVLPIRAEFVAVYEAAEREVLRTETRMNAPSGIVSAGRESVQIERDITAPATDAAREWEGWGTALKPATEPICLARKPLSEKSIAANVLKWGTGAINVDGCRIEGESWGTRAPNIGGRSGGIKGSPTEHPGGDSNALGRWPANLCHDGSDEVVAGFPDVHGAGSAQEAKWNSAGWFGSGGGHRFGDEGSAARFFYCAKAASEERGEFNNHPTVKPVALMRWLVRLVTPKGGTVLDPFMGSGSTALAADAEQFDFIGCELSPEYAAIAERRVRDAAGMFADVKVAA